jgi:hypothetical protein
MRTNFLFRRNFQPEINSMEKYENHEVNLPDCVHADPRAWGNRLHPLVVIAAKPRHPPFAFSAERAGGLNR